ncbi:MAG: hypothetical protein ACRD1S_14990, partial [Vicinamibacterales bacterium]
SWQESIETNIASAEAAKNAKSTGEVLHAFDYQAYAYLQGAQDQAAKRVLDELDAVARTLPSDGVYGLAGAFALAAIPARYALERCAWNEAAALEPRPGPLGFTEAMTHFARALGAARGGSPAAARVDIDRLKTLGEKLAGMQDSYWAGQVDVQRRTAEAWVAFADGRRDDAIAMLRAAAEAEDVTDKSAVSPGPLAPARELLGEMLLEAGRPKDALVAFEATMAKEPNRFRGIAGAMRAAEAAGDRTLAAKHARQLLEIAKSADSDRPDLVRARQLGGKT